MVRPARPCVRAALSAVREMRISQISHVISLAKSEAPSPARERDELRKTACDLLLRLQLVMLQETAHRQAKGLPPPLCPLSLQGGSGAADELDAARQMRELLVRVPGPASSQISSFQDQGTPRHQPSESELTFVKKVPSARVYQRSGGTMETVTHVRPGLLVIG